MQVDRSSPLPLYLQLEQMFDRLILERELAPHDLLPSVPVLAAQVGVSSLTVQKAYRRLQERGLIYSVVGRGTFVAEWKDNGFVAILVHHQVWIDAVQYPTFPLLIQHIREELTARRIPVRIITDTYPRLLRPAPLSPDVLPTLERERVQGLILARHHGSEELFRLMRDRQIPTLGFSIDPTETAPHLNVHLKLDRSAAMGMALDHFQRRGIDDVALIWTDRHAKTSEARKHYLNQLEQQFHAHGIPFRQAWILGVDRRPDWAGYHAMDHLWQLSPRPRGLIVTDDVIGRGVLMGVLERRIRVPADLDIVVQGNLGSPITHPPAWQRYVFDLPQWARTAAGLMQDLIAGRSVPKEVILPPAWETAPAATGAAGPWFRAAEEALAR